MTVIFTTKTITITYTNQSLTQVGSTYNILSFLLMEGEQKFSTIYYSNSGIFDCIRDECLGKIFSFISGNELWLTISVVCNRWRKVGLNNVSEFSLPPVRYSVSPGWVQRMAERFESIGYSLSLFNNLKSFSIYGSKFEIDITDGILYVIANNLSETVRHLNISLPFSEFSPFGLAKINMMLPNIEVLVLSGLNLKRMRHNEFTNFCDAIQSYQNLKILSVSYFDNGLLPSDQSTSAISCFQQRMLKLFDNDILGCHQLYVQGGLKKLRRFESETLTGAAQRFTSKMIEYGCKGFSI